MLNIKLHLAYFFLKIRLSGEFVVRFLQNCTYWCNIYYWVCIYTKLEKNQTKIVEVIDQSPKLLTSKSPILPGTEVARIRLQPIAPIFSLRFMSFIGECIYDTYLVKSLYYNFHQTWVFVSNLGKHWAFIP